MDGTALRSAMGMGGLPENYFEGKNGRSYRFLIFEDVVKLGPEPPRAYGPALRDELVAAYRGAPEIALYAHVPWCAEECTYCHYWGKMGKRPEMEALLAAERAHATLLDGAAALRDKTVTSIYFGGGTPSVLPRDLLEEQLTFFRGYKLAPDAEVCVEASVSTLTREKFELLARYATRLSIGIQSFNDRILSEVARTFRRDRAIETLREAVRRFPSVNIDLLYGLRRQTMGEWLETIDRAIELEVQSVTLYRLEVRDDPPLLRTFEEDPDAFPDELTCRQMRHEAKARLEAAGYRENIVGWFLRPTVLDTKVYRERWQRLTPCVAFGPHAQNYGGDHFYINLEAAGEYAARAGAGELPIGRVYTLGPSQRMLVWAMAQWKSNRPVSRATLHERFAGPWVERLEALAARWRGWGLVGEGLDDIELTDAGRSLLEWMLAEMLQAFTPPGASTTATRPRGSLPLLR